MECVRVCKSKRQKWKRDKLGCAMCEITHEAQQEPVQLIVTAGSHHANERNQHNNASHSNDDVGSKQQLLLVDDSLETLLFYLQPCPQTHQCQTYSLHDWEVEEREDQHSLLYKFGRKEKLDRFRV